MKHISSETEFRDWILRKLGAPVIQINVDQTQVEDAIDEAVNLFCLSHMEGSVKNYYAVEITEDMAATRTIKLPAEANIEEVISIVPSQGYSIGSWHTPVWQATNSLLNGSSTRFAALRLTDYVVLQQNLHMLEDLLAKPKPFVHTKYANTIRCDFDLTVGECVAFEVHERVDPRVAGNESAWNDPWLKDYATAKVQERWGNVLVKMQGISLPGSVTLDGTEILNSARGELERLEAELRTKYQEPIMPLIG
ncbi:neck protein [Vibrio phage YC]|uniref:Neck protein n=1 Tax=Vibrio phage YC TaxID=2267403 RepID=A0A384ZSB9_9CAUD|nr:neck protein [Vibrio phage YC]AXC34527.1 neck protein [Vibrio phage YC]